MPVYQFQLQGGTETRDEFFRVADMPELGQTIVRDGKTWVRVLSTQAPAMQPIWKPYSSLSLPRWMEGVKHDQYGRAQIESQAQEREVMAKLGRKRD